MSVLGGAAWVGGPVCRRARAAAGAAGLADEHSPLGGAAAGAGRWAARVSAALCSCERRGGRAAPALAAESPSQHALALALAGGPAPSQHALSLGGGPAVAPRPEGGLAAPLGGEPGGGGGLRARRRAAAAEREGTEATTGQPHSGLAHPSRSSGGGESPGRAGRASQASESPARAGLTSQASDSERVEGSGGRPRKGPAAPPASSGGSLDSGSPGAFAPAPGERARPARAGPPPPPRASLQAPRAG